MFFTKFYDEFFSSVHHDALKMKGLGSEKVVIYFLFSNSFCENLHMSKKLYLFADKMGWLVDKKQNLWDRYIQNSPQHADLSDEEIMEEVRSVCYGQMWDNY